MNSYSSLQSTIADFLARDDMTTQIKTFITLAEQRMSRELQVAFQESTSQTVINADQATLALPADLRSVREVASIDGNGDRTALRYLTPSQLSEHRRANPSYSGLDFYSIIGQTLHFREPISESVTIEILYDEGIDVLSDVNTSNIMLTRHGDAYLHGALKHAYDFLQDEERARQHDAFFSRTMAEVIQDNEKQRFGVADLQIRRVATAYD